MIVKIAGFVAFANYLQAFEALASWYSKWLIILAVCTIIFGIGYLKDESAYVLIGVAVSDKFAISSPLGKFVYRIGFYF